MLNQNIKSLNDYENLDFIDKYMYLNKKAQNENNMLIFDESKAKTPGLMFSFMWFMEKR